MAAHNAYGSGSGIVVNEFALLKSRSEGKGLSACHSAPRRGMVLKAMQDRGWGPTISS